MLTKTGKSLALLRKKQTMDYFKELLDEIQFYDLGKFYIKNFELNEKQKIILVIPEKCNNCSGKYVIELTTKTGLKCEKLVANYHCNNCSENYTIEFCLPLIKS